MVDYKDRLAEAMKGVATTTGLAAHLGLSYQAVKKVLEGKSKAFTAANNDKAARFLKVSPTWLATGEGPMRPDRDSDEVGPMDWRTLAYMIAEDNPLPVERAQLLKFCDLVDAKMAQLKQVRAERAKSTPSKV